MKINADIVLHNAHVYTLDPQFTTAQALAIGNGNILQVGSNEEIINAFTAPQTLNLRGAYVYPGFYDAHCHLLRYAQQLGEVHLFGLPSFEAVIAKIAAHKQNNPTVKAIIGRGWNQTLWQPALMPDKTQLDLLFPDIPVLLTRIDLHAAVANQAALNLAGIDAQTTIEGGIIALKNGKPSGLLIDQAVIRVEQCFPATATHEFGQQLIQAQQHCFAVGLTSVTDALVTPKDVAILQDLYQKQLLQIRINALILATAESMQLYFKCGISVSPQLTVRTFKFFADGALGSRGAWLQQPYTDEPGNMGLQLLHEPEFTNQLIEIKKHGFQVATHAIGDAANQFVLNSYAKVLPKGNKLRWRLEHAQIMPQNGFDLIEQYNIIPSVQPTHATSDMYWVQERIGQRVDNAYALRRLLQASGRVAAGSDFPVEDINPLLGFYAAVLRQDVKGFPVGGFKPHEALTREDALKAMTVWAAYASFEETYKGSLEPGKFADITILDTDLLNAPIEQIPHTKVLFTLLGGKVVYQNTQTP